MITKLFLSCSAPQWEAVVIDASHCGCNAGFLIDWGGDVVGADRVSDKQSRFIRLVAELLVWPASEVKD